MIDIKGIRFLYTNYTTELIYHHLVKGFNYGKFSKRTEVVEGDSKEAKELKDKNKKETSCNNSKNESIAQEPLNFSALKKVALIGIRFVDP